MCMCECDLKGNEKVICWSKKMAQNGKIMHARGSGKGKEGKREEGQAGGSVSRWKAIKVQCRI